MYITLQFVHIHNPPLKFHRSPILYNNANHRPDMATRKGIFSLRFQVLCPDLSRSVCRPITRHTAYLDNGTVLIYSLYARKILIHCRSRLAEKTVYSIKICAFSPLYGNEETCAGDLTVSKKDAFLFFLRICRNTVTPCTLLDTAEDFLLR